MCALSVKGLSAGLSNKELRKAFCTANAVASSNATHNNSKFEARNHIQFMAAKKREKDDNFNNFALLQ